MRRPLALTVMLGGPSAEREVSLRSGTAIVQALRRGGHTVHELDPRDDHWRLHPDTEVVFLALHGTYGEDGAVQARLDELGMPYTGCDAAASRLAFDKALAKRRWLEVGVPTAPFCVLTAAQADWPAGWAPPVVVKPVRQGSSVGLQFVERAEELGPALATALRFDTAALIEPRIPGREVTVGILDGTALPVIEVRPKEGVLDFRNKYTKGATEFFCPARFAPPTLARVQAAAWRAFETLGGRDYARVDVMVQPDEAPVVLEVNTLPGMTETSLLPKAAAAVGIDFDALCGRMVALALERRGPGRGEGQAAPV